MNYWTLNLSTGQKVDLNVVAVGTNFGVGNAPSAATWPRPDSQRPALPIYPTTVPSSPISIGPGLVMASDNTLGSFSPYEGRIYAAFVGYYNVTVDGFKNPATNTDIFLTYSDDGGRSWSDAGPGQRRRFADRRLDRLQQTIPARDRSTAEASTCPRSPSIRRPAPWSCPGATPATTPRTPGSRLTSPPASTAATPSVPRPTPIPRRTAINAITGATEVLGPMPDNESSGNNKTDAHLRLRRPDGSGRLRRPALPDLVGQLQRGHDRQRRRPGPVRSRSTTSRW